MTPDRTAELRMFARTIGSGTQGGRWLHEALDEIERLHADLHAMRTELIEAKRERNAALDAAREASDVIDQLNQRIGGLL